MGALVVGYGNPLRGDDGAGWRVAELVGAEPRRRQGGALLHACHQLTPELAPDVARASVVVFVDASTEVAPGDVSVRPVSPGTADLRWSHDLDPAALLAVAARLYGAAPPAFLVTVGGSRFDAGERLSPPVEAALPAAVEAVVRVTEAVGSDGER